MSLIILIRGRAGVGKTTLSNELGKELKLPIIRKDDIYDSIFNYIQDHHTRNRFCYELIYQMIKTTLDCKADILVDAPFSEISELKEWVTKHGGVLRPILCICSDEELWAHRFNKRGINPKPNQMITDFEEMKKHYGDSRINGVEGELILDSVHDLKVLMEQSKQYLGTRERSKH